VIARSSAFTYKGRETNAREIGKELGVAYLLEGSLQKIGNRLRVIVQLIETEGGAHVWSSRFDGAIDDFFDLEDRITQQVAGALQPSIRIAEIKRSRRKRPQDLSCYDYTMRAMPHVWTLERDESTKALELLEKALTIDAEYPLALVLAGWCHAQRAVYTWVDDIVGSQAKARSHAERAADLSGDDPLVLAVLGAVHTFVRNHGTARVLLERAVSLDPNCAWAWSRLGWIENYGDQPDKAIENFERALRLSPTDPMNFNNYVGIASAHEILEEYDKAAVLYRRALAERPNAVWIYRGLAAVLSGAGRIEEAKQALFEVSRNYPDLTISKVRQAIGLFRCFFGSAGRKSSEARFAGLTVRRAEVRKVSVWSARGTFETCRLTPAMSVHRGRPELRDRQNDAKVPKQTSDIRPHCASVRYDTVVLSCAG
jgi:adenylate cyclase